MVTQEVFVVLLSAVVDHGDIWKENSDASAALRK
jgi:hypothetical protein